jgi:hypothetical protein
MAPIGGDVSERRKDEAALVESGVRQGELIGIDDEIVVGQQVDVDEAWAETRPRLAAKLCFEPLALSKQLDGR